jgi:type I restriction-modification system DNA methylase subunit
MVRQRLKTFASSRPGRPPTAMPPYEKFDYLLANPPFGVDWRRQQKEIEWEHDKLGVDGRFGAGLPRVNDGLLFLQHMISKFEPVRPAERKHGSCLGIVFSGSPLFSGGAGRCTVVRQARGNEHALMQALSMVALTTES